MMPFYDKSGRLTAYALSCGYVELCTHGEVMVRLWHEHSTYRVRGHDHGTGVRLFWETFGANGLSEARAFYLQKCKEIKENNHE